MQDINRKVHGGEYNKESLLSRQVFCKTKTVLKLEDRVEQQLSVTHLQDVWK
jgi:hypothetical protein